MKRRTHIACGMVAGILMLTLWIAALAYMGSLGWPETSPDFILSFYDFFAVLIGTLLIGVAFLLFIWLVEEKIE
ncbi:unnamed protein product [marine sediment metagenome]|uniref:Uncharacterized protein n=1 Tax=marine sediment metagenome TaxID=412755 RepID=X0XX01_9ZZZZ